MFYVFSSESYIHWLYEEVQWGNGGYVQSNSQSQKHLPEVYLYYSKPSTNREMLNRTMRQVDHFESVSKCAADQMLPYICILTQPQQYRSCG